MSERELKCIAQRVQTRLENHEDAVALLAEVQRLRGLIRSMMDTVCQPIDKEDVLSQLVCSLEQALGEK